MMSHRAQLKYEPISVPRSDPPRGLIEPIPCPCCQRDVPAPTLDMIVDHYRLRPIEARILGAVWKGKGFSVPTEAIFDAMYANDPDGGPSYPRMYATFKVSLCRLRDRLRPSGVSIENVGYRRGYRIIMNRAVT